MQTPTVEKEAPTATPVVKEETKSDQSTDGLIAYTADVPPGSSYDFWFREKPAILVNLNGEYKAYRNMCSHEGCQTKYSGGTSLGCPCHGAAFDAATGDVMWGPAQHPLVKIEVFIEGDSIRYVA